MSKDFKRFVEYMEKSTLALYKPGFIMDKCCWILEFPQ